MMSLETDKLKKFITEQDKIALTVDCVVFGYDEHDKELKILLIKNEVPQFLGMWSLLGDLMKIDETIEDAANRILEYRTGLKDVYLEEVQSFSHPKRHPLGRVITIAYYALIKISDYELNVEKLDLEAKWFNINEIEEMAFDHKNILEVCHKRLQERLKERPVGFSLLPKKFTLQQIQNLYETVLQTELDKRNFRRKLKNLGLLKELEEIETEVAHRPARLYTFDYDKYTEMERKGRRFSL